MCVDSSTFIKQQLGNPVVAPTRSLHQGSVTILILVFQIGMMVKQDNQDIFVSPAARVMKCSIPLKVNKAV